MGILYPLRIQFTSPTRQADRALERFLHPVGIQIDLLGDLYRQLLLADRQPS